MAKMEKLIVVRHGDDVAGQLSSTGRFQMEALTTKLKDAGVVDGGMLILTSPEARAIQSAEILATAFGAPTELCFWLFDETGPNFPRTIEAVNSNRDRASILTLVAHEPHANQFLHYFGMRELKQSFGNYEVERGNALILSCIAREITHVK